MKRLALKVLAEYTARYRDGLLLYVPLPHAEPFHACMARTRLASGSNQAGKTNVTIADICRVARGMDPYRKRADHDLKGRIIGKDENHIGDPLWRKMWWPGAFDMVPDENTGFMRSVRLDPANPRQIDVIDLSRKHLWQPSPPMLPPFAISEIAWNKKRLSIPSRVTLRNGTVMMFNTSKGSPRQGDELDWAMLDEEFENKKWLSETQSRLLKRDGILVCSFTPQAATHEYFALHERAAKGSPLIQEFRFLLEDNPYIPQSAKDALFEDLKDTPDELAVRYYGEYAANYRKVYPSYNINSHGVTAFTPPDDWMRLMVLDPGTQWPAALFLAVNPEASELHAYAEVYLRNATAQVMAEAIVPYTRHYLFEVFIIDKKGGEQNPMGHGQSIADHYSSELKKLGITSRLSGSGFRWGSPNVDARELSLKRMMACVGASPPILRVHIGETVQLDKQISNRYYVGDKREKRTQHDLVDCLEYGAAWFDECRGSLAHPHGLYWRQPEAPRTETTEAKLWRSLKSKKKKPGISLGPVSR